MNALMFESNLLPHKMHRLKMNLKLFEEDIQFLKKFYQVIILKDPLEKEMVIVCPELQSKIMTSTFSGMKGPSLGYINYDLISSQKISKQINPVGGEDRFWLGPEGGQYSIFFDTGKPFTLNNCYTPSALDREAFEVISVKDTQAVFRKNFQVKNFSNSHFDLVAERTIKLIKKTQIEDLLDIQIHSDVQSVGFESINTITNVGTNEWKKESGLLSIWILGMFPPSDQAVVIFPFKDGDSSKEGSQVNDQYFGKVPKDRLKIHNNTILFKADGKFRSKIGLSVERAMPLMGSYDPVNHILTICTFTFPEDIKDYVNSLWKIQNEPYKGDVINSYNDGPTELGSFGGFYELESSSPALALRSDESYTHIHQTIHLSGTETDLNSICIKLFKISINEIKL
jgi:hypothetical protein